MASGGPFRAHRRHQAAKLLQNYFHDQNDRIGALA
jgi:hypothetical protein